MATDRSSTQMLDLARRISRRRFAQGLAATPLVVGRRRARHPVSTAQDKVQIKFWTHTHPPMVEQNEAAIAEFMAANPDIEVQYEIIPNMSSPRRCSRRWAPAPARTSSTWTTTRCGRSTSPAGWSRKSTRSRSASARLDELKAAYIPGAFEGATVDGKIYGLPSEFNVTAFAINTAAFEEVGLDPASPPKTWDEVGTMGQELVVRDGDTLTRRGFDFLYLHAGWYHNQLGTLMLQTGGRYVAAGRHDGDRQRAGGGRGAADLVRHDLRVQDRRPERRLPRSDRALPGLPRRQSRDDPDEPLGHGARHQESAVYEKYAIVPLPQVDPAKPAAPLYAYYWAVNAQTTDERKREAAFRLVSFLASQPGPWLKNVNFIQPRLGWNELPEAAGFPVLRCLGGRDAQGQVPAGRPEGPRKSTTSCSRRSSRPS